MRRYVSVKDILTAKTSDLTELAKLAGDDDPLDFYTYVNLDSIDVDDAGARKLADSLHTMVKDGNLDAALRAEWKERITAFEEQRFGKQRHEDKRDLKPARENFFYRLATAYGEQPEHAHWVRYDAKLAHKNRHFWNRWWYSKFKEGAFSIDMENQNLIETQLKEILREEILRKERKIELEEILRELELEGREEILRKVRKLELEGKLRELKNGASSATKEHPVFTKVQFHAENIPPLSKQEREIYKRIIAEVPEPKNFEKIDFSRLHFTQMLAFEGFFFMCECLFDNSTIDRNSDFRNTRFCGDTSFHNTRFNSNASFRNARFSGDTTFFGTHFNGHASFHNARFNGNASFESTDFKHNANFKKTHFAYGRPKDLKL